ncbi:MAG: hypothetical protein AAF961_06035, partial [Planctomycetota bacterium]
LARESLSPEIGAVCTVVFRRDLVGIERMSPAVGNHNGTANHVSGRFRGMNGDWIVLEGAEPDAPEQWIPRQHVLLLRVTNP